MIKQSKYWERVREAAQDCVRWRRLISTEMVLKYTVLPSDLRKCVLEIEEERGDQGEQSPEAGI